MMREYRYSTPKSDVLEQCKIILNQLDYEIDIYAPESHMLVTKPIMLKRAFMSYDYVVYIQITDRVEVHLAAESRIFSRSSESTIGGTGFIEIQPEPNMPYSLQKKIFVPIHEALKKKKMNRMKMS